MSKLPYEIRVKHRGILSGFAVFILALTICTSEHTGHESEASLIGWHALKDFKGLKMAGLFPSFSLGPETKKPLSEEQVRSGIFRYLRQITGLGVLDLQFLYQRSGAEDFEEFSYSLTVAHLLRLDRTLVLRGLHEKDLDDILEDFAIPDKQADQARKLAKKHLKEARKIKLDTGR